MVLAGVVAMAARATVLVDAGQRITGVEAIQTRLGLTIIALQAARRSRLSRAEPVVLLLGYPLLIDLVLLGWMAGIERSDLPCSVVI